jgi:hypothetical protein
MTKQEKATALVHSVVEHIQTIHHHFLAITPLFAQLDNPKGRGLIGNASFSDKVQNDLGALLYYGEKSALEKMITMYSEKSADKPAYPNESKPAALMRTLAVLENAMRDELPAEQFPEENFAVIKASLRALHSEMTALKSLAPSTESRQR